MSLSSPDGDRHDDHDCEGELETRAEMERAARDPFGPEPSNPMGWGRWRNAPDCARCNDTGRFREGNPETEIVIDAHCTCKRGRRMSELWYAEKHGFGHPDMPEPEPDFDQDGAPF